jgi:hypothetical protein
MGSEGGGTERWCATDGWIDGFIIAAEDGAGGVHMVGEVCPSRKNVAL